ncbi:MAG: aldo/keto reductase family protein, partial [Armatimonadota bacterium]
SLGSWLTYGEVIDQKTTRDCIYAAYDVGINFFDTANVYARGRAEEAVGQALAALPRNSYVLATKCYFPMGDGPNDRGLSRKHIFEQCHHSLRRLRTDYIDLYQCHRYDEETPLEETLRALDDLVTQGKVLYVGVSQWTAAQISDALRLAGELNLDRIVSNQPAYNMLNRGIEDEVMPVCGREGIGLVVYSPLAQGVLTGKYKSVDDVPPDSRAANDRVNMFIGGYLKQENLAKVERLRPIAARLGVSLAKLALAWCLRRPEVSSVIVGASRASQVEENAAACEVGLSDDDIADIEKALQG